MLVAAFGAVSLSACKPKPKPKPPATAPFLGQVRAQLSLAPVLAAEDRLRQGDTPEARLALARACAETADHAGAALALYPLLRNGDPAVVTDFVQHAVAVGWLDEATSAYRALSSPSAALTLQLATADAARGRHPETAGLLKALEASHPEPNTWKEGAEVWLQVRRPEEALRWARHSPESRDAALLVARCLFAAGRYPEVIAHLEQARLTDEPRSDFWIGRAQARSPNPKVKQLALERLSRAAEAAPGDAVAAWEAGRALLAAGRPRPATGLLSRALKADYQTVLCYEQLSRAYEQLSLHREALWARGRAARARGPLTEAQRLFQQSLDLDRSKPAAYVDLAKAYSADLKPQQALQVLERAQKIAPRNLEVAMLKAAVLGRLEKVPEQVRELQSAAELDPRRANEPLGELGKLYHGSQQYDLAITTLERAVQLEEGDALAHLYLGLSYARRSEDPAAAEQAVLHLLRTTRAQPDFHYPWINAGSTLLRLGHLSEAATCFRRAIDGDSRWEGPYVSLAQVLQRQGRPAERKLVLELYARARKLETERSRLEDATNRQPKDAQVRYDLGSRLLRDGRHREAFDELIQAVTLRPSWKEAQLRFADVCALLEYDDLQKGAEDAAR